MPLPAMEYELLKRALSAMVPAVGISEITTLPKDEEQQFRAWVGKNRISDVDHPNSHYDYRGFWKEYGDVPIRFGIDHFPDTYKQHGHPTFSIESKYSQGMGDGGMWLGDTFVPPIVRR